MEIVSLRACVAPGGECGGPVGPDGVVGDPGVAGGGLVV